MPQPILASISHSEGVSSDYSSAAVLRRREKARERYRRLRDNESTEARANRLNCERIRSARRRIEETVSERASRLADENDTRRRRRNQEAASERASRLAGENDTRRRRRNQETASERASRLADENDTRRRRRNQETASERASRLANENDSRRRQRLSASSPIREAQRAAISARVARHRSSRMPVLYQAGFSYDPSFDYSTHTAILIGKMDKICRHCCAKSFDGEHKGLCCSDGKVKLNMPQPPPEPLKSLFSYDYTESRHFMQFIRRYNASFQMTSFGTTGNNMIRTGYSPTFTIQGQIYHRIGSLLPVANAQPQYLQIYFMGDAELQLDRRTNLFTEVRRGPLAHWQSLLHENNSLIQQFKTSLDRMPSDEQRVVIREDRAPVDRHARCFNAPMVEEVAAVLVDADFSQRDIVIQKRNHELKRIVETHPFYDPLQYPLIFWKGQNSWHVNVKQIDPRSGCTTERRVSPQDYYSYLLMERDQQWNHILACGPLLNQFVVDMYAKIEAQRLLYYRLNQSKLRTDSYINLRDAIASDGVDDASEIGQRFILPSTFIGGPRHMHEYAQDALVYVMNFGRPCLFITFTCNPEWPEISAYLLPDQPAHHRPDICARVFALKLSKLIKVMTVHEIFGRTRAFMYSIEWQKRGLPHSHILIWFQDRIRPEQIDDVISAELPDLSLDPRLHDTVTRNMMHGPCGHYERNSPCMVDGKCSKRFPKPFVRETQTGRDGYPLYRRRSPFDGGHIFTANRRRLKDFTMDNSWVVPHSPLLCNMFNAHINVEYCHSVRAIKYITKYINKGSDMAILERSSISQLDEISLYQTGRYICSGEAIWRILSLRTHMRAPSIQHLAVHLENGQQVYFTSTTARSVAENCHDTTLTAFFKLCRTDEFARSLLYVEVPRHYSWNQPGRNFQRRATNRESLGRVYGVHPNRGECFYLRMLLMKIRGPTSFEDLRKVDGRVCGTYREACLLLGLLEADLHWEQALSEAATVKFPEQLRSLFATIISICAPSNPLALWNMFKEDLSEDILLRRRRCVPDAEFDSIIFNQALIAIEDLCLRMAGRTCSQLGLPGVDRQLNLDDNMEIYRETNYDTSQLTNYLDTNRPSLVPDQRIAFEAIINAIENNSGGVFFIDAPGGTGKTFLLNLILAHVRSKNEIILATASSGIAATLLVGGRTAHSAFKLPLDIVRLEQPICTLSKSENKSKMLQRCKAIIWDECTMSHKMSLESLNLTLQDIRSNDMLMGGLVVVLAGDFRQTLPVIRRSTPADEINACLKQSKIWRHVRKFELKTNMRVHLLDEPGAETFSRILLEIGDGVYSPDQQSNVMIKLTRDLCTMVSTRDELIERVFPNLQSKISDMKWLHERAILAPTNEIACDINIMIQNRLCGAQMRTYLSLDTIPNDHSSADLAVQYPVEFLNSQTPAGFPPHELSLKIGSPIMLLRNLEPPKLCNGTRLCVKRMEQHIIQATILVGEFAGEDVFIPRIPMIPTDILVPFKRLQFPIRLAYAMTINKSQGQSLKVVGIDLTSNCFSHGQFYVACSRVGSAANMFILSNEGRTKNIVYQQALN